MKKYITIILILLLFIISISYGQLKSNVMVKGQLEKS